mgnify:CR=1 FL=1
MHAIIPLVKAKAKYIFLGVLTVAVLVYIGKQTVFKPKQAVQYQTATVERGTIMSSVLVSGQIVATSRMSVITKATGQVKEVFVKDGDMVAPGQKLVELIPDQQSQQAISAAWATYLSAKNTLAAAAASLYSLQSTMFSKWKIYTDFATNSTYQNADATPNTTNRILTQFTTVQDDWLAAEAAYKNQQGVITQAQAAVTNAWNAYQLLSPIVTAPMAGTVTDLTHVPGMMISEKIASIVSDSVAAATFSLSEADVVGVKGGQRVTMMLDAFSGKTYTGVVVGVNRSGVTASGVTTYPATVQLDTAPEQLVPNMSVSATIITATKESVLVVPSAAIRQQGSQSTVRVLVRASAEEVPVETGLTSDTQTEIISGISEGDTVVTGENGSASSTSTSSPFGVRFGGFGGGTMRTGR